MDDEDELIEVFRTRDELAAQVAIDEVLAELGIEGFVHDRVSHMLPAPATLDGGYFVAVPAARAVEAARALREALEDGALADGEVADLREAQAGSAGSQ
jgi:argininosuccinate synthase